MLILKKTSRASSLLKPFFFSFDSFEKRTIQSIFEKVKASLELSFTSYKYNAASKKKDPTNKMIFFDEIKKSQLIYFVKG